EADDAIRTLNIISKLKPLILAILPADDKTPGPSVFFQDGLNLHNIPRRQWLDTSIQVWERVLPLWLSCSCMSFLKGPSRQSKPDIGRYHQRENGVFRGLH